MADQVEVMGDLLELAEKKLGVSAGRLLRTTHLSGLQSMLGELASGDSRLGPVEEAAACGAWIIRNRPFRAPSREIGYAFMRLMLKQAEVPWPRAQEDARRIDRVLRMLEAGLISEEKFVDWACLRVATA